MNYNSFLKKDYKNISPSKYTRAKYTRTAIAGSHYQTPVPRSRLKRIHIVLLVGVLITLTSFLISVPDQAEATRVSTLTNTADPQQELSNAQITLELKLDYQDDGTYIDAPDQPLPNKMQRLMTIDANPKTVATVQIQPETPTKEQKSVFSKLVWSSVKIKPGDSLALIFNKQKLNPRQLHDIIALGKSTAALKAILPGQQLKFRISDDGDLQELIYIQDSQNSLHLMNFSNGFQAVPIIKTIEKRIKHAKVVIHNSLFEAGQSAGLSNNLIMELAGIFGWDIDFALDIRVGDQFSIVYHQHFLDGKKIRDGAILAAEFINQKKHFQAVRFTDNLKRTDYYTPGGLSMRKTFLRSPVDFRRISSRFGNRKHPVLNYMRLHKGVDYAARRGTPIRASGDGKIIFKRRKGGYGRAIIINHGGKYSTLYAHLQSYKKGIRVGKKVKQGQVIAYVGSSGRTTGPHLHYEFRVNGVHRNPLTVKLPNAKPINSEFKAEYLLYASKVLAQLDNYNQFNVATIDN